MQTLFKYRLALILPIIALGLSCYSQNLTGKGKHHRWAKSAFSSAGQGTTSNIGHGQLFQGALSALSPMADAAALVPPPPPPPPLAQDDYFWAVSAASSNNETALDIAVDSLRGAIYVVGKWDGGLQGSFGNGTGGTVDFTTTYGGEDAFVAKYDTGGVLQWAFKIGGTTDDAAYGVAVSPNSDTIYVCGSAGGNSSIDYTGMPGSPTQTFNFPNTGKGGFIAAYDTSGFLIWAHSIRPTANNRNLEVHSVAAADHGVYTTGYWDGPAQFGGALGNLNAGATEDAFVLRQDPVTGTPTWVRRGQASGDDCQGHAVTVDENRVYFTGDTREDIDFDGSAGPITVANTGNSDIFITSYDISGNYQWAELIQSVSNDHGRAIVAGENAVFLSGNLNANASFPGIGTVVGGNGSDFFLSAHDKTDGSTRWQQRAVGTGVDLGNDLCLTPGGDVMAILNMGATTDFSGTILMAGGGIDFVTVRYHAFSGNILSLEQVSGTNNDRGHGIACYQDTVAFVAATIGASADFLPLPTLNTGFGDDNIAIARLGAGLLPTVWDWAVSQDGNGFNCANSVALDTANQWVYVAGTISDSMAFDLNIPESAMNFGFGQGLRDGFVAKYDYNGTLLWAFNISSAFNDEVTGITVGVDGNIYVTGYSNGTTEFRGTPTSASLTRFSPLSNDGKMFVAGYNPVGEVIWANLEGGDAIDRGLAICANDSGIFVTGIYSVDNPGGMIAGQNYLHPANMMINSFVARYDYTGTGQWLAEIGTAVDDTLSTNIQEIGMGIASYGDSLYVIGMQAGTNTTIVDGKGTLQNNAITNPFGANEAIFVASFMIDGTLRWEQGIFDAGSGTIGGFGIDADCDGVYITGSIHDNSPFPSGAMTNSNHDAVFLAQLSHTTGQDQWLLDMDGNGGMNHNRVGYSLDADELGNVFLCGKYVGNNFNNASLGLPNAFGTDVFIFEYRNDGVPVDGFSAGSMGDEVGYGLAVDAGRQVMFGVGLHGSSANFVPFNLVNGPDNIWVGRHSVTPGGFTNACCAIALAADAGADQSLCLGDSVQLNGTGGVNYAWTPTTGLSCTTCPNPMASPATTTTYTLNVDDGGNCVDSDTVRVTVNQATAGVSPNVTVCEGDSTQLLATGGNTFSWTPTTGLSNPAIANPMAAPTTTTIYQVVVTDGNSCKDSISVTVTVEPLPTASAGVSGPICPGDSAQLTASGGTTYSWSPTTGLSNPNIANPMASPATTTLYTVTVTDVNTCSDTATANVIVNPAPTVSISPDTSVCAGDSAQLAAGGGLSYAWSPATGLSNPNIANPKAAPASTIIYTVVVTGANSCVDSATVTVTIDPLPTATANNSGAVCQGDSALLTATGGTTYSWSPTTGLSNPNIANPRAAPGTTTAYTVTVTDGNSCSSTAMTTVTVNPLPTPTATSSGAICPGDSAQLTASGGTTYSWSPTTGLSDPNIANPMASPATTTLYTVTVTDVNTCSGTASANVIVLAAPVAMVNSPAAVCFGDSAQLTASGGTTYSWSPTTGLSDPNIANPKASPATTTVYTVTVGNGGNCTDTASVTVGIVPLPVADAGPDSTICRGSTYQLQATGGGTYAWSPTTGLSNPNIANPTTTLLAPVTYVVTVTSLSGCQSTDTVSIGVRVPQITFDPAGPYCVTDAPDTLTALPGGGSWTGTGVVQMTPGIFDPAVAGIGSHWVYYTGTDSTGCSNNDSLQVVVGANPSAAWSFAQDTVCASAPGVQLNNLVTGTPGGSWSSPTAIIDANDSLLVSASPVATHLVTYVASLGGCRDSLSRNLTIQPDLNAAWTAPATICEAAGAISLNTLLDPGATPGGTWSGNGVSGGMFDPTGWVGPVAITYDVGNFWCDDSLTQTIFVLPDVDPTWDNSATDSLCNSSQLISLDGLVSGTTGGTWTGPGVTGGTLDPNGLSGNVTVTYTVGNPGCEESLARDFFITTLPLPDAGPDTTVCGNEIPLSGLSAGVAGDWSPVADLSFQDSLAPMTIVSAAQFGSYVLTWTSEQDGCTASDNVLLTFVEPLPAANAGPDQTLSPDASVILNADPPLRGQGSWLDNTGTAVFANVNDPATTVTELAVGDNTLIWTIVDGPCQVEDPLVITILEMKIPTGFSPNGDGTNDTWVIRGISTIADNAVVIFNRWGSEVYRAENYQNDWDGRNSAGEPLADDTYYFVLTGQDFETVNSYLVIKR